MNQWSEKTLKLVSETDYLDKLQVIYPHEDSARNVSETILQPIRESFEARDNVALLTRLLNLKKFPYKDSYVAFLRKDRQAIARNPQTVDRICNKLYNLGLEGVIAGATAPKEANTRRGNSFVEWMHRKFPSVDARTFRASRTGIVLLDANEADAKDFCNRELEVGITKRPDLVAKANSTYVIGEAKFLSSAGGNQDRAFEDGITLATNVNGRAQKIFMLDGIHWINRRSQKYRSIEHGTAAIFSVLLLEEFLNAIH